MFLVRYELGFISQKTAFFIVTAVKPSDLTRYVFTSALYSIVWSYVNVCVKPQFDFITERNGI
jgi:hypothetical protein